MAIDEINESGGLLGRKLEVKSYDSQSQMQFYISYTNDRLSHRWLSATVLGYHQKGVAPPLGTVDIGAYKEGGYTFFVIGMTALLLIAVATPR